MNAAKPLYHCLPLLNIDFRASEFGVRDVESEVLGGVEVECQFSVGVVVESKSGDS